MYKLIQPPPICTVLSTCNIPFIELSLCLFSPHLWQSFLAGSLLDEIRKRLQTGDLKNSEIIWNRHLVSVSPRDCSNDCTIL